MKKRFVSVILTLCMVLGMVPLKAFAAESETFTEPKVTQLTVSCDGGEPVDLLGNQPTVSMPAGSKPVFTVTFDSTELLNKVFVTSTKDGETKYLEATLQDGKYVTDSYFDPNDTNYIPGTIAVTYSKKILKIDESGNIGGTDLNTLKTQLTAQNVSSRNEATGADGTVTAEIVLGDTFGAMANVYFDVAVSEFTAGAGVDQNELNKWLGVYQNLSQLSSYDLESTDGKQFTLYLGDGKDFGDPDTYLVMIKDATSNKYTRTLLQKAADKAGLGDISNALSSANLVVTKLLEYNAISKDTAALREEIEAHPTMTQQEKMEANEKITALDRDKKLFMMGMMAVSLMTASVGGAPLIITAIMAGYSSIADYFWDYRVGMILGNESPTSELAVSGTCGEHLNWSLNGGGTLTISGYGSMTEFPSKPKTPWYPYTYSGHIKQVKINSGATSIGRTAFGDCYQLTNVSIPNTVESIGEYAFSGCNRLERIIIPGSINTMGAHVFDGCSSLTNAGPTGGNYDIQFGWEEEIPANAFLTIGSSITNVVIPDGIKRIGDSAFFLTDIENVQIPDSVISIGSHAFASTKLSSITVPNSVVSIGENAFSGCTNLTNITLPQNLISIGANAFYNTGLFNNESNWESNVLYIGNYLIRAKTSVNGDYHVKQGTKCVADQAFDNGRSAIYYDNLTSVIMPSSIEHIGRNAFSSCLSSHGFIGVYFKGNAPTVYDGGTSEQSFYDHTKLFYLEGKEGWDTGGDSRWHGYPVATWEDTSCQHTYTSVITAATCTERGFTTYTCSLCGNSYKDNFTDAFGHNYGDWVITQKATATANGQRERICSRCNNKETEIIPATGGSPSGENGGDTWYPNAPSNITTTTTKNPDGSTTATVTNKTTGVVSQTTRWPDGRQEKTVTQADGSKQFDNKAANGTTASGTIAANGRVEGTVKVSSKAVTDANGGPVELPLPNVPVAADSAAASTIKVDLPNNAGADVAIPVSGSNPGVVTLLVNSDGTETVLKKSVLVNGRLYVPLTGDATVKIVDNSKDFSDMGGHWSADAVTFVTSRELFEGDGNGNFMPNNTMTRAMLVTVLHRLENTPAGAGMSFDDVANGLWYTNAVSWAAENKIVEGHNGSFNPSSNVTREQIAVILYRYAKAIGVATPERGSFASFLDGDSTSGWAQEAMSWAVGAGLFSGSNGGRLNPGSNATRAEVATILIRFVEYMVK